MDGKSFHTQLKFSYSKHLDEVEYGVHDSHTVYSKKKKKSAIEQGSTFRLSN